MYNHIYIYIYICFESNSGRLLSLHCTLSMTLIHHLYGDLTIISPSIISKTTVEFQKIP